MDALTHSDGETLDSLVYTEVAAVTPSATGKLTVEIDNVLQPANSYTVNGSQITFNEAKPASATISPAFASLISSLELACIKSILPTLSSLSLDVL